MLSGVSQHIYLHSCQPPWWTRSTFRLSPHLTDCYGQVSEYECQRAPVVRGLTPPMTDVWLGSSHETQQSSTGSSWRSLMLNSQYISSGFYWGVKYSADVAPLLAFRAVDSHLVTWAKVLSQMTVFDVEIMRFNMICEHFVFLSGFFL